MVLATGLSFTVAMPVPTPPTLLEPTIILASVKLRLNPTIHTLVTLVTLVTLLLAHMGSILVLPVSVIGASRFLAVRSLLSAWNCQWILYKALSNPNITLAGQRSFFVIVQM